MLRRLILATGAFAMLSLTVVIGGGISAAHSSTSLAPGSKWIVKSKLLCPMQEIFGSPGHLTFIISGPGIHVPGKYTLSGKTIAEQAPGYMPGPLGFRGTWSKTKHAYAGTLTSGLNHDPATLSPGVVKGCPS
jgi:hypothetical protein